MSGLADELSVGDKILIILGHFRDDMPPEAVRELQEIAALRQPTPIAGDMQGLVEMHLRSMASLMRGAGDNYAAEGYDKAAAVIQSLTARLYAAVHQRDELEEGTLGLATMLAAERAKVAELVEGLGAAIRAANLGLFVIRKQGVMPNSSWESGFDGDLKKATSALEGAKP